MFYINPFRRIKDLEYEVDTRDNEIKGLKDEIERLKDSTKPKYHPNVTCTECEYCIVERRENYGTMGYFPSYYCRLNNNCEDYTLKE